MKYFLLIMILFFVTDSNGSDRSFIIPETAQLIHSKLLQPDCLPRGQTASLNMSCQKLANEEYIEMSNKMPLNHCSDVYITTRFSSYLGPKYIDGRAYMYCRVEKAAHGVVQMDVHCVERSLSESYIVSLAETCKITPLKECFEKELMDKMATIVPTKFHRQTSGSCGGNAR